MADATAGEGNQGGKGGDAGVDVQAVVAEAAAPHPRPEEAPAAPEGPSEDEMERRHYADVCTSFSEYQLWMLLEVRRRERAAAMLSDRHKALL